MISTPCHRTEIYQTMNPDTSNNLSLKYQRFTPSGCKDIGIKKFEFVAKTQFLSFNCYFSIKLFVVSASETMG